MKTGDTPGAGPFDVSTLKKLTKDLLNEKSIKAQYKAERAFAEVERWGTVKRNVANVSRTLH